MEETGGRSFGGRLAGGDFELLEFLQRPQTIVRLICLIFAIVVFGCISDGCYMYDICIFNSDSNACNFGIAIGVIAFLACLAFIVLDTQFNNFSNAETRRHLVIGDLVFSGFWCFMWFVAFCYLADTWRKTHSSSFRQTHIDHARSSIAFSFFSIITWGGLTIMALRRFRAGTDFDSGLPGESSAYREGQSPYASFPTPGENEAGKGFQSQPFGATQQPPTTEYNVPNY
eukprot:gene9175-10149_t